MSDNLVNNESEIRRILSIPNESDDEFADIGLSDDENFELPVSRLFILSCGVSILLYLGFLFYNIRNYLQTMTVF